MKSSKTGRLIALAWLLAAFALTVPIYLHYQEFFRLTGPYFLLVRSLPLLCAAAIGYSLWLRPLVARYEMALLITLPLAVCVVAQPLAMLAIASVALTALVLGDFLTPLVRFEDSDAPVAWTCGFGILILIGVVLGKLGLLSPTPLIALCLICSVLAVLVRKRLFRWLANPFATWKSGLGLDSSATGVCLLFLLLIVGCSVLLAMTPVTAFDVVLYHFPLARHYAQTHSIQPTPWIPESYFPQGAEVLMAIAFSLAGEPAARLIMPFLGCLLLWLLVRVARSCGLNRSAAVAGVAIAATFPFLQWTLSVPKNDSAFSLFQLAGVYSFLQWQKGRGVRWLILLSFLLGQTAGIKHVAIFGLVAMAPLCLYAWVREKLSWRVAMPAIALFLVSGIFWHVQTWILSGDPFYPRSASQAIHTPSQEHGGQIAHAALRYATLPWYLLFHGEKAFESSSRNPLGVFCFLFLPLAAVGLRAVKWSPARKTCACFAIVYLLYWSSVGSTLRYAIVPFAMLAVLIGAFLVRALETPDWIYRGTILALTSYCFLFSLLVVMSIEVNSLQISMLLKQITPEEYLLRVTPAVKPLFRLAKLHPGASAFAVDSCARYYAPDPLRFMCTSCMEGCQTKDLLLPIGSRLVEFVIAPADNSLAQLKETIVSNYGATKVDDDGKFQIFRLSPNHSPLGKTR